MEEDFSFYVDRNSNVISWGEQVGRITGKSASKTLGRNYRSVFPKILSGGGQDAVSLALSINEKIAIKGFELKCPGQAMIADVIIDPLRGDTEPRGAKVTVSRIICPALKNAGNARRFLDIGKTASTLAHGVRNPLNAMKGAVLYLSKKYKDEKTLAEFAEIMDDEITKFDNFISKFLSTSVSDTEAVLTDINLLLKKIEVLISFQTRFYHIETTFEFGDIPLVTVNAFHLEHAILNVINNAVEIMRAGGTLGITTRTETNRSGSFIVMEISDTGPGSHARKSHSGVMIESGGKGFGLLITREILKYYGGHLEVRHRRGGGTKVFLYLSSGKAGTKE